MTQSTSNAFADVPCTVRSHFVLHGYAAVYCLINHIRCLSQVGGEDLETIFETYPFLAGYFREILQCMPDEMTWDAALEWWDEEIAAWEQESAIHLPLRALTTQANIPFLGRLALVLVGLVEEDSRFGTLFAKLQEPLDHRRPCLELVGRILMPQEGKGGIDAWDICQPLVSAGLVDVANREAPRSEWVLRVPPLLWDMVRGDVASCRASWYRYHAAEAFSGIQDLIFPPAFLARLQQMPALVRDGKAHAIVLRGSHGSGGLQVMGALARALGCGVIEVNGAAFAETGAYERHGAAPGWPSALGPLCAMTCSLPVLVYDLGPGETAELPSLTGYQGPVGILMGLEGGLTGQAVEKAVSLTLPMLTVEQRTRHWRDGLEDHPVTNLAAISERFHMPGGYIRQAASMAIAHATLDQRDTVNMGDIREACRTLNRQVLDTLATHLDGTGLWGHLVVSNAVTSKLRELQQRCRHRERLLDHLGSAFGTMSNRGVRALFTGASGTGKTLAARILAAELEMDVYRVDLAAVVNKYIGETEKNLHRVLSRAEELDVILLLDEGDALLGTRTQVKSANDRYANLETNYLLQRLEYYQGIVIVTTNAADHIDSAFQRRMDVVVHFVSPQAHERLQIWYLHLPQQHAVDAAYLEEVALRCAMTGGQIRNAALHAAMLALDQENGRVTRWQLEEAIHSEYRKAGSLCPLHRNGRVEAEHGGMEAFLNILT